MTDGWYEPIARLAPLLDRMYGVAAQAEWSCEDGWVVAYTTSRVQYGPHDGRFLAMAYKPVGKGARTGKASRWVRAYQRPFTTRKAARARAERLYYQHSPKAAARHGRSAGTDDQAPAPGSDREPV